MTTGGTDALGDGELTVLNKNFNVLTANDTVADSDTIYIGIGTTKTYPLVPESGSAITARKIRLSDPIIGNYVTKYSGRAYAAMAQQVSNSVLTAPTAGREYIVRCVYKDLEEHPGMFKQEWRYTATAADAAAVDTFGANLVAAVNNNGDRRVTASYATASDTFTLTGRAIPGCTTSLNDIDEVRVVSFDAYINYIDTDGYEQKAYTVTVGTRATTGSGTWQLMRDLEKESWGYEGVYNRREFPVILPEFSTNPSLTYHIITIEHEVPYKTPNNLYLETTQVKTIIAIPDGTNGDGQQTYIRGLLNPWMASTPKAFANISSL